MTPLSSSTSSEAPRTEESVEPVHPVHPVDGDESAEPVDETISDCSENNVFIFVFLRRHVTRQKQTLKHTSVCSPFYLEYVRRICSMVRRICSVEAVTSFFPNSGTL